MTSGSHGNSAALLSGQFHGLDDLILFRDFDDAQWESIRHSHVELPVYPRGLVAWISLLYDLQFIHNVVGC